MNSRPMMQTDDQAASMRTVVAASAIGTTIEWYDFLIYATASRIPLAPEPPSCLYCPYHHEDRSRFVRPATISPPGEGVRYLGDKFPPFRDHHCEEGHQQ